MRVPVALHPCQQFGIVSFLDFAHSKRYVALFHYCFNLQSFNYKRFECGFICLYAVCTHSLVMCLFGSFAHFLTGWFVFLLLSSFYILDTSLGSKEFNLTQRQSAFCP